MGLKSGPGLGRVKTPRRKDTRRDLGRGALRGHFTWFGGFSLLEMLVTRVPAVLGVFADVRWTHVGDGYALIAARSGWTPMMFITRVRL